MVNPTNCRVCRFNLLYYHLLVLEHSGIMRLLRFSVKVSLTLNNASEATSLFIYKVYFATVFPLFIASFWKLSIEGVVVWILLSTNTLTPSIVRLLIHHHFKSSCMYYVVLILAWPIHIQMLLSATLLNTTEHSACST